MIPFVYSYNNQDMQNMLPINCEIVKEVYARLDIIIIYMLRDISDNIM